MKTRRVTVVLLALLGSCVLRAVASADSVGKLAVPLDATQAKTAESTLGDVVAEAARTSVNADAALVLAGALRPKSLPAGPVTEEDLTASLMFPDEQVVAIELTGAEIQLALERSLGFLPRASTSFLQVAGVSVTFRSASPAGQRVAEVRIGAAPLAADHAYRVAMPASLAKGALGYYRIFGTRPVKQAGPSLGEALVKYVQSAGAVTAPAAPRLRDLSQPAK